ncbi:hypothetical protein GQ44DRAFT_371384 [Phaeosphaeriaceae sp. PMI808]|nr:hypothetical protein GQ44DRAFT_371384 [Phaeosphaeriaceae sp. PMI808]
MEFPEMLLLEAENGLMIRKEQELIALHMQNPENGQNSILQLLVGGGKSSVIMPMLAAHGPNKEDLVRVIVARSQMKQMRQMLVAKLGGLLNRRIYYMPISRDARMVKSEVDTLREIMEECI